MRDFLKMLIVIVAALIIGSMMHKCQRGQVLSEENVVERDTVIIRDTVRVDNPTLTAETPTGYQQYKIARDQILRLNDKVIDSLSTPDIAEVRYGAGAGGQPRLCDSVLIDLPTIQRHYADSTYEAWVSGPVDPKLDSLKVFTRITTITKKEWKPPKRWHIGPTIGIGYTRKGVEPFVGFSLTYSIFSF